MNITLKPMGVATLGIALLTLTTLALMGTRKASTWSVSDPVKSVVTRPNVTTVASVDPTSLLYDDHLQNGWENYSWAKNDFADTKSVAEGLCIRVTPGPFEALYLHHAPMSLEDMTA